MRVKAYSKEVVPLLSEFPADAPLLYEIVKIPPAGESIPGGPGGLDGPGGPDGLGEPYVTYSLPPEYTKAVNESVKAVAAAAAADWMKLTTTAPGYGVPIYPVNAEKTKVKPQVKPQVIEAEIKDFN